MSENAYVRLAAINVNEHVETKGPQKLSYLSWAWAVDQLLRADATANWAYDNPTTFADGTMMVYCTVTAFGIARKMQLPVMNHANKAIPNPDAFAVNTAMQRCLVKAIALHGLGLYIYAGEDLPPDEDGATKSGLPDKDHADFMAALDAAATDLESLRAMTRTAIGAARNAGDKESESAFTQYAAKLAAKLQRAA